MTAASAARLDGPAGADGDLLEVQGVGKSFAGVRVLRDVSLAVRAGEVVMLVGENGAGKSTLKNILSGLAAPDRAPSCSAASATPPSPPPRPTGSGSAPSTRS